MEARKGLWVLVLVELLAVRLFLALLSTEDMLPAGPLAFPKREERWRLEWPGEGARTVTAVCIVHCTAEHYNSMNNFYMKDVV